MVNTRSLSQYVNIEGKRIKEGSFYRGQSLYKVPDATLRRLKEEFGVTTVLDLRTSLERGEKPDKVDLFSYCPIPVLNEEVDNAGVSHDKASEEAMKNQVPDMCTMYAQLVTDPYSVEQMKKVIALITDPNREGGLFWHCSEGKDRAGVVAMFILKLLDFDDDVIFQDYMFSGETSNKKANKLYWLIRITKRDKVFAEKVKGAYLADRSYMESTYKAIESTYGSFDAFFAQMGVTPEIKAAMKAKYLV